MVKKFVERCRRATDSDVNKANSVKAKARQYKAKAKASHFKG